MLGRSCLGAMLVGSVVNEVDLSLCYELCAIALRPVLSRPLSYETLVWLLLAVTCDDSLTMSQAEVPLERIHAIYGKWVRSQSRGLWEEPVGVIVLGTNEMDFMGCITMSTASGRQ